MCGLELYFKVCFPNTKIVQTLQTLFLPNVGVMMIQRVAATPLTFPVITKTYNPTTDTSYFL